jgi:hypothetical protein
VESLSGLQGNPQVVVEERGRNRKVRRNLLAVALATNPVASARAAVEAEVDPPVLRSDQHRARRVAVVQVGLRNDPNPPKVAEAALAAVEQAVQSQ